jgi:hypothetical protein
MGEVMWTNRLRRAVVVLLVCGTGTGVASRLCAAEPKPPVYDETALKKALVEEARKTYEMDFRRLEAAAGGVTPEGLYRWSRRWLEAQLDPTGIKEDRIAALRDHLKRMRDLEKRTAALAQTGQGTASDASAGRYYRIQAELWLGRGRVR